MAKKEVVESAVLDVADVAIAVQVIDMASEKGLFKGGDLKPVGEARERLVEWIRENAPEQTEEDSVLLNA